MAALYKGSPCLENHSTAEQVRSDEALGRKLGVEATPTMFINGKLLKGLQTAEQVLQLVREAEETTKGDVDKGERCILPITAKPGDIAEAMSAEQRKCEKPKHDD